MNIKSWNIQRKILALLLGAGFLSFFALGTVSFVSMYKLSADAEKSGRRMGESAAGFTEEFAIERAKKRVSDISREKAQLIERDMRETLMDAEYIARSASALLAHPERHVPMELPDVRSRPIKPGETYIQYAPELRQRGISPRLAEEIELMSNIAEDMDVMGYYYKDYDAAIYIGSEDGYFIGADSYANVEYVPFTEEYLDSFDPRNRPWYHEARDAKKPIITDVFIGEDDGLPSICFAAPYYDGDRFAGVAGIGYVLDSLQEYLSDNTLGAKSIFFVLDRHGKIILSSVKEGSLAVASGPKDLRQSDDPGLALEAASMVAGISDVSEVTVDGVEYYLAYTPLPLLGWSFGTLLDRSEVTQPSINAKATILAQAADFLASVRSFFVDNLFRMVILLLVILAALVWGSRRATERFVRPILALRDGVREIAMGNFDSRVEVQTGDEIGELADSVNAMSQELKAYVENLSKVTAEKERIATELDLATNIQAGMLPSIFPTFSDRSDFALYATMHPAKEVGGDFYDFYMLDEIHVAVTVADVSGKGVPAALFMVIAKTVLKNIAIGAAGAYASGGEPDFAAVMAQANRQLSENNKEKMFVTVFFGVLDIQTGEFTYVNGGHNPPLVGRYDDSLRDSLHTGAAKSLRSQAAPIKDGDKTAWDYLQIEHKGFPLGVRKKAAYTMERLTLRPGDALYLYTDGVTEAMDEEGNLYGEERLQSFLNGLSERTVQDVLAAVKEDVANHAGAAEQSDDVTMLGLRYLGTGML